MKFQAIWRQCRVGFWIVCVDYLLIVLLAPWLSDYFLFQPPSDRYPNSIAIVNIPAADGNKIAAAYLKNDSARELILYSHGNAENLAHLYPLLQSLNRHGYSVISYDYPGYGLSTGTPSEQGVYAAITAVHDYVNHTLHIPNSHIILYGRSLGCGPTVDLAAREPVAGVILQSGFTSAYRVITRYPLFPFDKFNNIGKISLIHSPLLIIHGTVDEVIPYYHAQQLFQAANQPKTFESVLNAGHNDLYQVLGDKFWPMLEKFSQVIERHLQQPKL